MNSINIKLNGIQVASANETFKLDNGTEVPFSILYEGTTYLPMRKLAELLGKDVGWDGDTRTASLDEKAPPPPTSAPPSAPPSPIPTPTSKYVMYTDFPSVPDFGSVTGATFVEKDISNDGIGYYYYDFDFSLESLENYWDILEEWGFEFDYSEEINGAIVNVFYNWDGYITVVTGVAYDYFLIMIWPD